MKFLLTVLSIAIVCTASAARVDQNLRIPVKDMQELSRIDGRIVGGYAAGEGQVKYIVGLSFSRDGAGWWCGGSIIANDWVLTAAHCTDNPEKVRIFYGSTKLAQADLTHEVGSDSVIRHENYDGQKSVENDIALIRTPHVDFTQLIDRVELGDRDNNYAGWWSTACGWGGTSTGSDMPKDLQCADLQVIGNDECKQSMGEIADSILCVSTAEGKSTCSGDSGGPLVTHEGSKLVGVTSFGLNGCESRLPGGFSRVGAFRDWIQQHSGIA